MSYVTEANQYTPGHLYANSVSGGAWVDESGNGHNATLQNSASVQTTGGPGDGLTHFLQLDPATSDYASVTHSADFGYTGTATFFFFFRRPTDWGTSDSFACVFANGDQGYRFVRGGSLSDVARWNDNSGDSANFTIGAENEWAAFAIVHDSGTNTVYQRQPGESTFSSINTNSGTLGFESDTFAFGRRGSSDSLYLEGDIAGYFSTSSVLTISDMDALWDAAMTAGGGGTSETMSVGLGAITYDSTVAGTAQAGLSTSHPIGYDLSESASASAGMSTQHSVSYDMSQGGDASSSQAIQLPLSYDLSASSTATVTQAISGSISYALSVSMIEKITMSISMGTYSLDLTSDNTASATANISQDLAYDLTDAMSAQASMSVGMAISYLIQTSAQAAASLDASLSYSLDLTVESQTVTSLVTLSDGRTFTISVDLRTFTIEEQPRTLTIKKENRTLSIDP